jgi:uncharacterized protein YcbX
MKGDHVAVFTGNGDAKSLDAALVSQIAGETGRPLSLRDHSGANFDDSPVLIVNLATVSKFSLAAGTRVDHRRFRANLYIEGFEPQEEVSWIGGHLGVGAIRLEVVKSCERCVVITHDPDSTLTTPALLRVLTETSNTCMGVYCRVLSPGVVAVGDLVGPE